MRYDLCVFHKSNNNQKTNINIPQLHDIGSKTDVFQWRGGIVCSVLWRSGSSRWTPPGQHLRDAACKFRCYCLRLTNLCSLYIRSILASLPCRSVDIAIKLYWLHFTPDVLPGNLSFFCISYSTLFFCFIYEGLTWVC